VTLQGAEKALKQAGVSGLVVTDEGGNVSYVELRRRDGHAAGRQFRAYADETTGIAELAADLQNLAQQFAHRFPSLA